jgi:glutaredoxin 2
VRFALGVKNIKHRLLFLAWDDSETAIGISGKSGTPILKDGDMVMRESMDIVKYLEGNPKFGPTNFLLPASGRKEVEDAVKSIQKLYSFLFFSRTVRAPFPEFMHFDGRVQYMKTHRPPAIEKEVWDNMSVDEMLAMYDTAYQNSNPYIEELNDTLVTVDDVIYSEDSCSEGGLSYDDIDLYSWLRQLSIVKGVKWPVKTKAYIEKISAKADLKLFFTVAS